MGGLQVAMQYIRSCYLSWLIMQRPWSAAADDTIILFLAILIDLHDKGISAVDEY